MPKTKVVCKEGLPYFASPVWMSELFEIQCSYFPFHFGNCYLHGLKLPFLADSVDTHKATLNVEFLFQSCILFWFSFAFLFKI